jgi:hypothetical protein
MYAGVRWCRDMRVGRGDGSTDDADVCGLRPVRHTRPEVASKCVCTTWVLAAWEACIQCVLPSEISDLIRDTY